MVQFAAELVVHIRAEKVVQFARNLQWYMHLSSNILVSVNQVVSDGQQIGYICDSDSKKDEEDSIIETQTNGVHLHLYYRGPWPSGSKDECNPACYLISTLYKSDPQKNMDEYDCPISPEVETNSYSENINSGDPNGKVGNEGYSSQRFIKHTDELHYGIFFENVDSATAPAQDVSIVDTLDLTKVDKSTFYLEGFTAGEMLIVLSDSIHIQNLDTIYKKKPINGTYVHIQATFDTTSGIVRFLLTSLDIDSLLPVTDPLAGFLPPDTSHFDGNGLVSYKIMPLATIHDDTVIYNTAHIIFDTNPPIATGTWFNTIDRVEPASHVNTLLPIYNTIRFPVSWTGTDDGAGISGYDIYFKTSGDTSYTKWLSNTTLFTDSFTGVWGSTYEFYSIAYDSVGNVENKLPLVEASTTLQDPVGISYIYNSADLKIYPNPTTGKLAVEAQLDKGGKLTIEIYNLLNQKLHSFEGEESGKKFVRKEIDVSNQSDGFYFIRLSVAGQSFAKKFLLKKN